jgi:hypothetical protein
MGLVAIPVFRAEVRVDLIGRLAVRVEEPVRVALAADPSPTTGGAADCGDPRVEDDGFLGWFQVLKKSSSAFADTGVDTDDLLVSSFSKPCLPGRLKVTMMRNLVELLYYINNPFHSVPLLLCTCALNQCGKKTTKV